MTGVQTCALPICFPVTICGSAGVWRNTGGAIEGGSVQTIQANVTTGAVRGGTSGNLLYYDPAGSMYADLSTATAATINQLRQAFQIQRLYERDARGGSRYTEIIRSHFGVDSPDQRQVIYCFNLVTRNLSGTPPEFSAFAYSPSLTVDPGSTIFI